MLNGALRLWELWMAPMSKSLKSVGQDGHLHLRSEQVNKVIHRYAAGDYCARDWYEADPNLRRAIDFLTSEEMLKYGDEGTSVPFTAGT